MGLKVFSEVEALEFNFLVSPHTHNLEKAATFSVGTGLSDTDCASMLDRQEIDNTTSIVTNWTSSVDTHQCHPTSADESLFT